MNSKELYIIGICAIHLLIWLVAVFGGIFSNKILFINIFILLPSIYITQTNEFHPITTKKIRYILKNKSYFKSEKFVSYCYNKIDLQIVENLVKELNVTKEDIIEAFLIIQYYENYLIIPNLIVMIFRSFCKSFSNPFSPQGFIIFGYIINSIIFLGKYHKIIFKSL